MKKKLIQDQLVNPDMALKLKELGYNEITQYFYATINSIIFSDWKVIENINLITNSESENFLSAPCVHSVRIWFILKHDIHINTEYIRRYDPARNHYKGQIDSRIGKRAVKETSKDFNKLLLKCLEQACETLEQFQNKAINN